jgi:iron complex outermembrane recepter protein
MKLNKTLRKLLLVGLLSMLQVLLFSQKATVTGTVKNSKGEPLESATVQYKSGTDKGTVRTDANGNYTFTVNPGSCTVTISFAGYTQQSSTIQTVANQSSSFSPSMESSATGEAVSVVGSRNKTPRIKLNTPAPVDIIPISQIANEVGQVDVNQLMTFVAPSFQSARQAISDGTDHVDPAQLRGLGPDQILVLVNGKRRHQSSLVNVNGTVNRGTVGTDMSAIPVSAIERIEILRDGAAAQYGSDAIAGVINIVLKKKINYLDANVSYGLHSSAYDKNYALNRAANTSGSKVRVNDGNTIQGGVNYGVGIGKSGYFNVSGEYTNRDETNRTGTYTGQIFPLVGGANVDDATLAARGLTRNDFDMRIGNSRMKGMLGSFNMGMPIINSKTNFYSFGTVGRKQGNAAGFYRYPNAVATAGGAALFGNTVLGIYPNGFLPEIASDVKDASVAFGVTTKIKDWNIDISNTYGQNKFDFDVLKSISYSQASVQANPVTSFDAGGLSYKQQTINFDADRKVKLLEGMNVALGAEYRKEKFDIRDGDLSSTYDFNGSANPAAGSQVFAGFVNTFGGEQSRTAISFYSDNELDITKDWLVTGALRFENYSDFGNALNYKFSTLYKIDPKLSFRASTSTGFRAPSMQQKYYTKTNTVFVNLGGGLVPVESGTFPNGSKPAQILGIPELKQETSTSTSAGITATPFKGFEATIDVYSIKINDRIVLSNNFTGGSNAALNAQLNAAGAGVANFFTNAINTRATGLEAVFSYTTKFKKEHNLKTTLAATFIKNTVEKDAAGNVLIKASPILAANGQLGNYFNREDISRIEIANPVNKLSLIFNYKVKKFTTMLRFVHFGKVAYWDPTINPATPATFPVNTFTGQRETLDQMFSAKTVTDLSVSYKIKEEAIFTIGANNLLNVYPDKHTHSGNVSLGRFIYSRRVQQMGFNGAYFFARLKVGINTK